MTILNWGPGARVAFDSVEGYKVLFEGAQPVAYRVPSSRSGMAGARVTGIDDPESMARHMERTFSAERQLHVWCRASNRGLQQWALSLYPRVVIWQEESPDEGGHTFTDFAKLRFGRCAYWTAEGEKVTGYRMP